MNLICKLENGIQLISVDPLSLEFTGSKSLQMRNPDSDKTVALTVERIGCGKYIIRVAAILVNALPFPVQVCDESNTLVLGQTNGVGLLPGERLPVIFPVIQQLLPRPDTTA
ncbi:vacuolar protein sorting-associated protein 13 family protein, partial [Trypanosoma theileri]